MSANSPSTSVGSRGTTGGSRARRPRSGRSPAVGLIVRLAILLGLVTATIVHARHDPGLASAQVAHREGDTDPALRGALDCLSRRPRDLSAARIAAASLSQLLYPDEAEPYYQMLRDRGEFQPEDAHARALGLTRANRREQAVAAYEEVLAKRPDDAMALQRLAALQWSRGRLKEALPLAERLAAMPEGAVAGHTILAEVHHDAGEREEALAHFRRVVELDPSLRQLTQPRLIFWSQFGEDLLRTGRPAEARKVLQNAVRQVDDPVLLELLGQAHLDDGDPSEAARWWRSALDRAPERVSPWLSLARLDLQNQRFDEALATLDRVLVLAPNQYEALSLSSAAHRALGHTEKARAFQERADRARRARPAVPTTGMGADAVPQTP